jgi:hypothetical protein
VLNRFLFRITSKLPCRLIQLDSGPYLERYYVGTLLGVTFYLHRFVSSDSERHIHNHPWKYGGSLILTGSYLEERLVDICPAVGGSGCMTRKVRRRFINIVNGNTFHRICDTKPGTWSLFFHGKRQTVGAWPPEPRGLPLKPKGWGFLEQRQAPSPFTGKLITGTLFVPYPPTTDPKWWETAKTGETIGRVPLC